jgi:hypothetical protein
VPGQDQFGIGVRQGEHVGVIRVPGRRQKGQNNQVCQPYQGHQAQQEGKGHDTGAQPVEQSLPGYRQRQVRQEATRNRRPVVAALTVKMARHEVPNPGPNGR